MPISNLRELKPGTSISYSMFRNLIFRGIEEPHAVLEDPTGERRSFYVSLVEKYGNVNTVSTVYNSKACLACGSQHPSPNLPCPNMKVT